MESLHHMQNFGQCPWSYTLLGRQYGQMCDYIPAHGLYPMVQLDGQGFGRSMTGKLEAKVSRRQIWEQTSPKGQRILMHLCLMYSLPTVMTEEKDFNNQVSRKTHSVDKNQFLSIATLVFVSGLKNKVTVVAGMETMDGVITLTSTEQVRHGYSYCRIPSLPRAGSTTASLHSPE